jgi:triosephosphate isomerase
MRKPLIVANWKMNKTVSEALEFVKNLKANVKSITDRDIVICAPFTSLASINELLENTNIYLGAQNLFWEEKGAYTGEISPVMLVDVGCKYVIIGHSERRQYFGEMDETVNKKLLAALKYGLIPIVCVGETLEQREKNITNKIIEKQVKIGLSNLSNEQAQNVVIAYEPVWAIGTGKTATPQQAQEVQEFIRKLYAEMYGKNISEKIRILYGGSIKPDNFSELMKLPDIDGGLIGGASLNIDSFIKLIKFE